MIAKNAPTPRLVSGPTMAIQNSSLADSASRPRLETPPKTKRVIPFTGMPRDFATSEWESSCSKIEAKKMPATTTPTAQRWNCDHSGKASCKIPSAKDQVISTRMKIQLQCTPISMPAIFPILNELGICPPATL